MNEWVLSAVGGLWGGRLLLHTNKIALREMEMTVFSLQKNKHSIMFLVELTNCLAAFKNYFCFLLTFISLIKY